jgi:hypothetical protein
MKFIIGKLKKKIDYPRNMYRFELESMQGDADGENHYNYDFNLTKDGDIPVKAQEVITMFKKWMAIDWNTRCDLVDDLKEGFINKIFKGKKKREEMYDTFVRNGWI